MGAESRESHDLSHDLSHDQEEEEEGSMNVSGVSDISSDVMSRGQTTPPTTGPQTPPPLSSETTPTTIPAGVSDISSDMDVVSPSHSPDRGTLGDCAMETDSVSSPLTQAEGSGHGEEPAALTSDPIPKIMDPYAGGVSEDVGVTTGRPPPLDSWTGGAFAPPSPLSAQNTPSKVPGKRKVR